MTKELDQLRRREVWLADLLAQSRAQRRRRGCYVERYVIEMELGAVRYEIKRLEAEERAAAETT